MIEELSGDFLQWLRGFYYVAKTGNLRRAAAIMHRNPSTISYQIRSLEQELGTVLFDRYKKSLIITPEGEKLLQWAITTFEALQSMRSDVGVLDGKLHGQTTFAATLPFASLAVGPIADFRKANPLVDINIIRGLPADIITAVRDSQVDFGLLGITRPMEENPMDILFKSRPVLVVHKVNPWCIPAVPSMEHLQKLPYISFLSGHASQKEDPYYDLTQGMRASSHTVIAVNNYHLMMRFVLQGLGVAIMDELCLSSTIFGEDWSPIRSYPLDHILPNMLYGIQVRKHKHLSPQASALIAALREYFTNMQVLPNPSSRKGAQEKAPTKTKGSSAVKRPTRKKDTDISTKTV